MRATDLPVRFPIPFANAAGGSYVRSIPVASQINVIDGAASLTDGFPPLNFLAIGSGGVPPFGQDMNGLLKQMTQWLRWHESGGPVVWDSSFSASIGGYPKGALVMSVTLDFLWLCLVDNNLTNPDAGGSGWLALLRNLTQNRDWYVNPNTGNDSNPGTSGSPFATIQKGVDTANLYNMNGFTQFIHCADGTYSGAANLRPVNGQGIIQVLGNTTTPANCNVVIAAGDGFVNSGIGYILRGFRVSVASAVGGIGAGVRNGGSLTMGQMQFGNCAGPHMIADSGGVLTFVNGDAIIADGNCTAHIMANAGATIDLTGCALSVTGNITASTSFALSQKTAIIQGNYASQSITGSVTGTRYIAQVNGVIDTAGGGANYFPGTIAGTPTPGTIGSTGGVYV